MSHQKGNSYAPDVIYVLSYTHTVAMHIPYSCYLHVQILATWKITHLAHIIMIFEISIVLY